MSIDVDALGAPRADQTGQQKANDEIDKEAFLKLLVAQLRNQDPTSPMDSSQLMQQSTQLTTMEKLVELSDLSRESFALQMRMASASLVGQQVTWFDEDGAQQVGVVDSVTYAGEVPTVSIGDAHLPLDAVASVTYPGGPVPPVDDPDGPTDGSSDAPDDDTADDAPEPPVGSDD